MEVIYTHYIITENELEFELTGSRENIGSQYAIRIKEDINGYFSFESEKRNSRNCKKTR